MDPQHADSARLYKMTRNYGGQTVPWTCAMNGSVNDNLHHELHPEAYW